MEVLRNHKALDPPREKGTTVGQHREAVKVDICERTWELQRIAELVRKGNELRAKRVRQIKQSIGKGEYQVDVQDVARSIIRTEMSRYRETAMNVEPTELSILCAEKIRRAMLIRAV